MFSSILKEIFIFPTVQSSINLTMKPFGNIMEKGKYDRNQHFLHFPHCFLSFERHILSFTLDMNFAIQKYQRYWKRKNAGKTEFFPFPTMFSFKLSSLKSCGLVELKVCLWKLKQNNL